jgi:hypothetical protein
MQLITFARWQIECDPETTRKLYARVQSGSPEACGCEPYLNFAAARKQAYPVDVIRLFDSLGVADDREAEIYHTHRIAPRKHHYGGWFHFVGRIVSGADASKQITTNAWGFDLEKVSAEFELGFTHRIGLLKEPFQGHPVVQLEFQAAVPWVLTGEEPES